MFDEKDSSHEELLDDVSGNVTKPVWKRMSLNDSVGTVLAHDITEIRPGEFKGCAFRKGHVIVDRVSC